MLDQTNVPCALKFAVSGAEQIPRNQLRIAPNRATRQSGRVIRAVLFDIDGTLIRTGGAGVRAFDQVFATEFQRPGAAARMKFAGRTDPSLVREFFETHAIEPSPENFQRFFDRYVYWLDHFIGGINGRALPGVEDLLTGFAALPRPPLLGLLTGNIRLGAEIKLRQFKLWHHFVTGAFGDDHEDRNRLSGIARERVSRHLGEELAGEQILVVGDTTRDIDCARAIGAPCLAVATGGASMDELRAHAPEWLVKDLRQVRAEEFCA